MTAEFENRDSTLPVPCVRVCDRIRVGAHGERFWCRVTRAPVSDGRIAARVDNELVHNRWRVGEEIEVRGANVIEIATLADRNELESLVAATGSPVGAALAWRELKNHGRSMVKHAV